MGSKKILAVFILAIFDAALILGQPVKLPDLPMREGEKASAVRYSLGGALKWSAEVIFAPSDASRTKLLYAYDPKDCETFDWKRLGDKWRGEDLKVAFIKPQAASSFTADNEQDVQLYSLGTEKSDATNLLVSNGSKLCGAAKKNNYWILLDTPLPDVDYRVKLISKVPPG